MGERHDAEHSVAQARERLSAIAEELSRRASSDYVKERAREVADDLTSRAKVQARERTLEMRDRMLNSPWALGVIGGAVGAIAGKVIGDRAREHVARPEAREGRYGWQERYIAADIERPYDEYTATHGYDEGRVITEDEMYGLDQRLGEGRVEGDIEREGGIKAKASEKASELKERAGEISSRAKHSAEHLRERAKESAGHLRERMPSRESMPSRGEFRDRAQSLASRAEENSGLLAIGAMVAGAIFGSLVPVTRKEHQVLGPAKSEMKGQVKGQVESLKHQAMDRVQQVREAVETIGFGGNGGAKKEEGREFREEETRPDIERGARPAGTEYSPVHGTEGATFSADSDRERSSSEGGTWTPPYEPDVTRH